MASDGNAFSPDLYDAFVQSKGNTRSDFTPPPDVFGFGGQWGYYTDAETCLVLFGCRDAVIAHLSTGISLQPRRGFVISIA